MSPIRSLGFNFFFALLSFFDWMDLLFFLEIFFPGSYMTLCGKTQKRKTKKQKLLGTGGEIRSLGFGTGIGARSLLES